MRSKLSIGGHPIHPMLVTIPIGLFVWTMVADVVYLLSDRNEMWYDIAFWSSIGGIVSALIAAAAGFVDYFGMAIDSKSRGIATAHMLANIVVVALFFAAMLLMLDYGATEGQSLALVIILHAAGIGILGLSGWLGGEMVYRQHLGVIPDNEETERAEAERHVRGEEQRRLRQE